MSFISVKASYLPFSFKSLLHRLEVSVFLLGHYTGSPYIVFVHFLSLSEWQRRHFLLLKSERTQGLCDQHICSVHISLPFEDRVSSINVLETRPLPRTVKKWNLQFSSDGKNTRCNSHYISFAYSHNVIVCNNIFLTVMNLCWCIFCSIASKTVSCQLPIHTDVYSPSHGKYPCHRWYTYLATRTYPPFLP